MRNFTLLCKKNYLLIFSVLLFLLALNPQSAIGQIYEPEGLNMPGAWNGWSNPPSNLAFASSTQVSGGRVVKIPTGTVRWQTVFSVAASGGDIVGGTYNWLYTSGATGNYWANKWGSVTVNLNTLQTYTKQGTDNTITVSNGKWYTMNWKDSGYANTQAVFMETSAQPVTLDLVSVPSGIVENQSADISLTTSVIPASEEIFYLRYTINNWATSTITTFSMSGNTGTATIPAQSAATIVRYYAFSSTVSGITSDYDLYTIKLNNNAGANYSYTVAGLSSAAEIVSYSFPEQTGPAVINSGAATVDIEVAMGTSVTLLTPSITTSAFATISPLSGVACNFSSPVNYIVTAENGSTKTWTVSVSVAQPFISWGNLQWPGTGTVVPNNEFYVYAQVFSDGITNLSGQGAGIQTWIGYSTENTNPETWTNWVQADYYADAGNNDEYRSNIGSQISTDGTYYYASRFQMNSSAYVYGGFSATGGGYWNGTSNINGILTAGTPVINWANLQWPGSDTIEPGQPFYVFGRAWINGLSGGAALTPGLQAWVGFSTENTNPSSWTNWISASYNGPSGDNDEFKANLGSSLTVKDTFFYAMRYRMYNSAYVYGGFASGGGGFWNGSGNNSGIVTVGQNIDCNAYAGVAYSEPALPVHNQTVVIYFDATQGNQALLNYTGDVYAHTAVLTNLSNGPTDWRYTKSNWGQNTTATKLNRIDANHYSLTINTPRTYYNVPAAETIEQMVFVFRSALPGTGGSYLEHRNADGSDIKVEVYPLALNVKFIHPTTQQIYLNQNVNLPVCIEAIQNTGLSLYINNNLLAQGNTNELSYMLIGAQLEGGTNWLKAVATNGSIQARDSIEIYFRGPVVIADLPSGTHNGINYINDSTVTLVLHDPTGFKQYVYAIGEFNNWQFTNANYMKRTPDGKRYWVTLTGLGSGEEYAYQYFIDGNLKIADPYCEKILDPWNDQWISSSTYPDLKPYPNGHTTGVVSIFQTNMPEYQWQVTNFIPPALNNSQSDLLIYELLVRDFVDSQSITAAKEKLDYLKELGVNAVQLMPISEFDGNNSWGYSTNFFFAADKYYGTRQAYKEFIDAAHQRGIAVIMDIVPNHAFGLCPMVQMYFDPNAGGYGQPSQHNPWFNGQSPHGYSVGYDFNHESGHTRQFFKDVFQYWLTEFKVDGFRIDLSKGLTQKYSGGDIGVWNAYDQSRINILNDYKSHIKWVNPNAYVILEHFADNSEETVLANSGMMLWSAMHNNYKQVAMGWENSSNVSWAFHGNRGWNYPNLVDYMETHDEERMMTEALTNGNSSIYYNVRDFNSALHHQEQGLVLCLGIPGPKMLYQFQEMGYDYSVTYGGGRTSPKPPRWDYLDVAGRERLNRVVSGMAALRKSDAFRYGSFTGDLGGLGKRIWIAHSSMDVVISVNMGVYGFDMAPGFTKTGTWYDYFSGESFYVSDPGGHFFFFGPGDYRVFTSQPRSKPFHNLQVTVLDSETNAPINLATLHLSNAGNRTTDTNGLANFLALPQTVSVTAQKFGYLTQTKDTVISNNTNLTIKMVPGWDPASGWANLKWPGTGVIMEGQDYTVYAQAWINGITGLPVPNPGLEAWIGYSSTNTDPSTWTTWVPATYDTAIGNNNQYLANIGGATSQPGTWYYASRFRMDNGCFVYGGYSGSNGGFWNGVSNVSGVLTVNALPSVIDWANLQWPANGSIEPGGNFMVYSRVYIAGTTSQTLPVSGLNAWIGYSTTNTNPATWTNWIPANYSTSVGNNDEYSLNLGAQITTGGTYYYASRFRYNNGSYYYGGHAASGGGFWNGGNYLSGILNVLPSYRQVDLTVFLEGLYAGSRTMYKSQNETGDNFTGTVADKITVELHDNANYGNILHTAADVDLHTNGSATISIPYTFAGSYYLTVKHRNSLETTTATALSFVGTTIACDFSSSADQAFGSNMKNLGEGVFGIYGGDANADGSVDALDLIIVDNDASSFASGYLPADVNGDGAVDALDLILTDNNSSAFVAVILPW